MRLKQQLHQTFLKRVGEAEDLAGLITFLASDKANYMTGLAIQVDGGSARTFY